MSVGERAKAGGGSDIGRVTALPYRAESPHVDVLSAGVTDVVTCEMNGSLTLR